MKKTGRRSTEPEAPLGGHHTQKKITVGGGDVPYTGYWIPDTMYPMPALGPGEERYG